MTMEEIAKRAAEGSWLRASNVEPCAFPSGYCWVGTRWAVDVTTDRDGRPTKAEVVGWPVGLPEGSRGRELARRAVMRALDGWDDDLETGMESWAEERLSCSDRPREKSLMPTAAEEYQLEELGRKTVEGREWVAYYDGSYRHVVSADDWDRALSERELLQQEDGDGHGSYTVWCDESEFADDDTARLVAKKLDLSSVHSAMDGRCSELTWRR